MSLRAKLLYLMWATLVCSRVAFSASEDCAAFARWRSLAEAPQIKKSEDLAPALEQARAIRAELRLVAQTVFASYLAGSSEPKKWKNCFGAGKQSLTLADDFAEVLPPIALEQTLQIWENSNRSFSKLLAQRLRKRISGRGVLPFSVVGYLPGDQVLPEHRGGFFRDNGSLFLDIGQIPPNEWESLFAHVVFHALDPILVQAIRDFDRDAPKDDRGNPSRAWIMAGLNRGFLAEVRAWEATLQVYQEIPKSNSNQVVGWIEEMVKVGVFKYLDPRFTDPREGAFSDPRMSQLLSQIRQELRESSTGRALSVGLK